MNDSQKHLSKHKKQTKKPDTKSSPSYMFKDRQNCSVVIEARIMVASGNGGLTGKVV